MGYNNMYMLYSIYILVGGKSVWGIITCTCCTVYTY